MQKNIGEFIRQELAEQDQILCYYRTLDSDSPIPYICKLGCCPTGCCSTGEFVQNSSSYGWALALLVIFVLTILFAIIAMMSLYLMNKHKDRKQREKIAESSAQSFVESQISGPISYGQDVNYPYTSSIKQQY